MSLVLDASATLAWAFEREDALERQRADQLLDRLIESESRVPALWVTEVSNALLVAERRKLHTPAQTTDFLTRLSALSIVIDAVSPLAQRDAVLALARQYNLSSYDASYLELAMRLGLALASFDRELLRAAAQAGVAVC